MTNIVLLLFACLIRSRSRLHLLMQMVKSHLQWYNYYKIPEYPFSSPNYFLLFFCRSKGLEGLRPRYAVVILQKQSNVFACPQCGKNRFFPKYLATQYYPRKSLKILIIPHVCFSNACRVQQNTRAEQSTEYVVNSPS